MTTRRKEQNSKQNNKKRPQNHRKPTLEVHKGNKNCDFNSKILDRVNNNTTTAMEKKKRGRKKSRTNYRMNKNIKIITNVFLRS